MSKLFDRSCISKRTVDHNIDALNIELSAICNYTCVGCPTTFMKRKKGYMSPAQFNAILEEMGDHLRAIYLWNYGEPLLNPNVAIMIDSLRGYKCQKVLSTNGSMLMNFDDLEFMSALDEIIISINGLTSEVYRQHQTGNLETVLSGVHRLAHALKGTNTNMALQLVAHKGNLPQIPIIQRFAKEHGFAKIIIKSFNVMDKKENTFERFVPVGTKYARYRTTNDMARKPGMAAPCLHSMVINWNCEANVCVYDYEGAHVFGNVSHQGVMNIWKSAAMNDHRRAIMEGRYHEFCVECTARIAVEQLSVG